MAPHYASQATRNLTFVTIRISWFSTWSERNGFQTNLLFLGRTKSGHGGQRRRGRVWRAKSFYMNAVLVWTMFTVDWILRKFGCQKQERILVIWTVQLPLAQKSTAFGVIFQGRAEIVPVIYNDYLLNLKILLQGKAIRFCHKHTFNIGKIVNFYLIS